MSALRVACTVSIHFHRTWQSLARSQRAICCPIASRSIAVVSRTEHTRTSRQRSLRTRKPIWPRIEPGHRLDPIDSSVTIDDFCRHERIARVDLIKMDIEGSEAAALEGAHETIERTRPKLAVCLFRQASDLWTIPNTVRRRYPFYRLFLGHHSLHLEETVIYTIAE